MVYPEQCLMCPTLVERAGGLCADCWRQTPFLSGLVCDTCGASLPGKDDGAGVICDECLSMPRPWQAGRAVFAYRDLGRRMVLALKHGDRTDLAAPAAGWMQVAGRSFLTPDTALAPIPVHWSRLLSRRYNQAAELARALSRRTGMDCFPDALVRVKRTPAQDGMSVAERIHNVTGAMAVNPRRRGALAGRKVCLIDDVMTSGATLSAATKAARDAGVDHVFVLTLARVEKIP